MVDGDSTKVLLQIIYFDEMRTNGGQGLRVSVAKNAQDL